MTIIEDFDQIEGGRSGNLTEGDELTNSSLMPELSAKLNALGAELIGEKKAASMMAQAKASDERLIATGEKMAKKQAKSAAIEDADAQLIQLAQEQESISNMIAINDPVGKGGKAPAILEAKAATEKMIALNDLPGEGGTFEAQQAANVQASLDARMAESALAPTGVNEGVAAREAAILAREVAAAKAIGGTAEMAWNGEEGLDSAKKEMQAALNNLIDSAGAEAGTPEAAVHRAFVTAAATSVIRDHDKGLWNAISVEEAGAITDNLKGLPDYATFKKGLTGGSDFVNTNMFAGLTDSQMVAVNKALKNPEIKAAFIAQGVENRKTQVAEAATAKRVAQEAHNGPDYAFEQARIEAEAAKTAAAEAAAKEAKTAAYDGILPKDLQPKISDVVYTAAEPRLGNDINDPNFGPITSTGDGVGIRLLDNSDVLLGRAYEGDKLTPVTDPSGKISTIPGSTLGYEGSMGSMNFMKVKYNGKIAVISMSYLQQTDKNA